MEAFAVSGSATLRGVPPAPTIGVQRGPALRAEKGLDAVAGAGVGAGLVAAVTVFGILTAVRKINRRRPRVILGPSHGTWYQYKFRAKPGDKFKYRWSTDKYDPEFGAGNAECPDRQIKWGELFVKGTPTGKDNYMKSLESDEEVPDLVAASIAGATTTGALLLDCDGTLVETERDGHRVSFNQAFKQMGFDFEWDVALYGELLTTGGGKERMTRYFKDYNPAAWKEADEPSKDHPVIMELHKLKTSLFMDVVRSGALPLREGVKELISAAAKAGWKLAVCSTSNEEAVKTVVKTMLPEFANDMLIFAGDVVDNKKPDPEIYNMAARELGVAPMKCVVIEDAAIGVKAGKAAGMNVIVTKSIYSAEEDFTGADMVLGSAAEVDFATQVNAMLPVLEMA